MPLRPTLARIAAVSLAVTASALSPSRTDAREPPHPAGLAAPTLAISKVKLGNGLEVIVHEDPRTPFVSVNLWVHVGARDEAPGQGGFARLAEHLMWQGTQHVASGDFLRDLARAGGTSVGATTTLDRTNYFETVPKSELELALWLESDRLGFLVEHLDQKAVSRERDVVLSERKERVENVAYGMVDAMVTSELYAKDHPYRVPASGSPDDLAVAPLDEVKAFFRTWYAPNNATLVVAGDVDAGLAVALAEKYFGPIPAATLPDRAKWRHPSGVTLDGSKTLRIAAGVPLVRVTVAWPTPAVFRSGDAELDVAASALAGGKTSRLVKRLVYEMQAAESVTAYQESHQLGSRFVITATAQPGRSAGSLLSAIDEELARLEAGGVTDDELARGKAGALSSIVFSLDRTSDRANLINEFNQLARDPSYLANDMQRYTATTTWGVTEAVKRYLPLDRRIVAIVTPEKSAPVAGVLERVETTPPSPGASR